MSFLSLAGCAQYIVLGPPIPTRGITEAHYIVCRFDLTLSLHHPFSKYSYIVFQNLVIVIKFFYSIFILVVIVLTLKSFYQFSPD